MLSKGFNKEFFESIYKLNECGGCGANLHLRFYQI